MRTMNRVKEETVKTILRSRELNCPSCVAKIEKSLGRLDGVERAKVHFNSGKIEVEHDPALVSAEALVQAVRDAGYASKVSPF